MENMLVKVAELATALTKTSGIMSGIKGFFKGKQKPLSLAELLMQPEYTAYLTTKFPNPAKRAKALQQIQKKLAERYGQNIAPEALLHVTEQQQMLDQLQGMPSERIWDMLGRYGQYASEKPVQAMAGTLGSGYALKKGKEMFSDEEPRKPGNIIVA